MFSLAYTSHFNCLLQQSNGEPVAMAASYVMTTKPSHNGNPQHILSTKVSSLPWNLSGHEVDWTEIETAQMLATRMRPPKILPFTSRTEF